MTRSNNEAAEQLHNLLDTYIKADLRPHAHQAADAALAIERRATVERIRADVEEFRQMYVNLPHQTSEEIAMPYQPLFAILDEVAGDTGGGK